MVVIEKIFVENLLNIRVFWCEPKILLKTDNSNKLLAAGFFFFCFEITFQKFSDLALLPTQWNSIENNFVEKFIVCKMPNLKCDKKNNICEKR